MLQVKEFTMKIRKYLQLINNENNKNSWVATKAHYRATSHVERMEFFKLHN